MIIYNKLKPLLILVILSSCANTSVDKKKINVNLKRLSTDLSDISNQMYRNLNPTRVCLEIGKVRKVSSAVSDILVKEKLAMLYHSDITKYCSASTINSKNYLKIKVRARNRIVRIKRSINKFI